MKDARKLYLLACDCQQKAMRNATYKPMKFAQLGTKTKHVYRLTANALKRQGWKPK